MALANHATLLLRLRFLGGLGLKLALPVLVIFVAAWSVREWQQRVPDRIEKLGKAWGALDQRVARHRQFLMQTDPNAPNFQAKAQEELGVIARESSRIIGELNPLLTQPDQRTRLAIFLTAELAETLNLDVPEKAALSLYIQHRLTQGSTFNDAMKTVAEAAPTEATEIKAMVSPAERQLFDQVYGADGVLLFSYPEAVALGKIGP